MAQNKPADVVNNVKSSIKWSGVKAWRDGKRYGWLLGLVVPLLPFLAAVLVALTGWSGFWWLGPLFIFGLIPALDLLIGADVSNAPEEAVVTLETDRYYRWCTYVYVPLQYCAFIWAAWMSTRWFMSFGDNLGLALTVGVVNGIGINTGHELGHKTSSIERWLAKLALLPTLYGHFFVEHNRGHHVRVATLEDPASARMGESFWAFLPRTVVDGWRSAWHLEKKRLLAINQSVWSIKNQIVQTTLSSLFLFVALICLLGLHVWFFLLIQAIYGLSLLEVVNYIEHYGLLRQKRENGRYESCKPTHSWNNNHLVTNLFLFHLQRHSDHHANPTRRYQALRHFSSSPQLPAGYASMLSIAYIPFWWYRVMDGRVLAHYNGDIRKANLHPPKRAGLLNRFGGFREGDNLNTI